MSFATYEYEDAVKEAGYEHIAGVDEVGRGCLAGPVVAAAVIVPDKYMVNLIGKVKDSKKMTENARERMHDIILGCCAAAVHDHAPSYILNFHNPVILTNR